MCIITYALDLFLRVDTVYGSTGIPRSWTPGDRSIKFGQCWGCYICVCHWDERAAPGASTTTITQKERETKKRVMGKLRQQDGKMTIRNRQMMADVVVGGGTCVRVILCSPVWLSHGPFIFNLHKSPFNNHNKRRNWLASEWASKVLCDDKVLVGSVRKVAFDRLCTSFRAHERASEMVARLWLLLIICYILTRTATWINQKERPTVTTRTTNEEWCEHKKP